jgi:MraZ protein
LGEKVKDSLIGTYFHTLDEKGRMAVPFKLKVDLGDPFYITSLTDDCLVAYPEEEWAAFSAKLKAIPQSDEVAQRFVRNVTSNACKGEPDKQGRVLLPQALREKVSIDKDTVIVGALNRVEIWAKEKWHGYQEQAPSNEIMMQSAAKYGI